MDPSIQRVETSLTTMARRLQRVELYRRGSAQPLERTQYVALQRLYDQGPLRLSELATALELDVSTVSRLVRVLEGSGLLHREADPSDRRASILRLTAAGSEAMHRTRAIRRGAVRDLLASWPANDVAAFADLLERFDADWQAADIPALLRDLERVTPPTDGSVDDRERPQ